MADPPSDLVTVPTRPAPSITGSPRWMPSPRPLSIVTCRCPLTYTVASTGPYSLKLPAAGPGTVARGVGDIGLAVWLGTARSSAGMRSRFSAGATNTATASAAAVTGARIIRPRDRRCAPAGPCAGGSSRTRTAASGPAGRRATGPDQRRRCRWASVASSARSKAESSSARRSSRMSGTVGLLGEMTAQDAERPTHAGTGRLLGDAKRLGDVAVLALLDHPQLQRLSEVVETSELLDAVVLGFGQRAPLDTELRHRAALDVRLAAPVSEQVLGNA